MTRRTPARPVLPVRFFCLVQLLLPFTPGESGQVEVFLHLKDEDYAAPGSPTASSLTIDTNGTLYLSGAFGPGPHPGNLVRVSLSPTAAEKA